MERRSRKPKQSEAKARQSVLEYFSKQCKFKSLQARFEEIKQKFNDEMEVYFQESGITSMRVESDELVEGSLLVTRVQKSNVSFDADKLESALGKELAGQVIHKRYEIADVFGLITYLKKCGVDPKVFKSFLLITKSVDANELDRLEEAGKITLDQIRGCYTVNAQKPYFVVKSGKGKGESG